MKYGYRWDALILFDPPLAPPPGHRLHQRARDFELLLSQWAAQRQRNFRTTGQLASYFKSARRLRHWVPGAAELMAQAITRPVADGVELVCPPQFEADIYIQNSNAPTWNALPALAKKLFVIGSDGEGPNAEPPGLVSQALHEDFGIEVVSVRGTGHLLMIEQPHTVEKILRAHLQGRGFAAA
jgi:pimeloyl-ACP methyl ester carboxylesterase